MRQHLDLLLDALPRRVAAVGQHVVHEVGHEEEGGGDVKPEHQDDRLEQLELGACRGRQAGVQVGERGCGSIRRMNDQGAIKPGGHAGACPAAPDAWCCTSCVSQRKSHLRKDMPGVNSVPSGRCAMPRMWYLESRYGRTTACTRTPPPACMHATGRQRWCSARSLPADVIAMQAGTAWQRRQGNKSGLACRMGKLNRRR